MAPAFPGLLGNVGGGGGPTRLDWQAKTQSEADSKTAQTLTPQTSTNSGAGNRGFINQVAFPGAKMVNDNGASGGGIGFPASSLLPWIIGAAVVVLGIILFRRFAK